MHMRGFFRREFMPASGRSNTASRTLRTIVLAAPIFGIVPTDVATAVERDPATCKAICDKQGPKCLRAFDTVRNHPERNWVIDADTCGFPYKVFVDCQYCPTSPRR
jgi:hypothetical protein